MTSEKASPVAPVHAIVHRPYYDSDGITIYNAECLEVLGNVSMPSFDAVITDPPYMIGISSVGDPNSKSGTWADVMNAATWFAEWYGEYWKLIKPTGYMASFCNWRSLPCVMRGLAMRFIPVTSCVVWNKQWIGTGYKNAFRPTYEMIVISAKPEAGIIDRSQSDVMDCKWNATHSGSYHPAEKPRELLSRLIGHLTPEGGTVLDPFMGSGTTLVAAKHAGRKAVGIEIEHRHCESAVSRLSQEILF